MDIFPKEQLIDLVQTEVDQNIIPSLMEYVRIPNLSPSFDPEWEQNHLIEQACDHVFQWAQKQKEFIPDMIIEKHKLEGAPEVIFVEINKFHTENQSNILLYGHYDKQPHFSGWREGLGPTTPVIEDEKLYGRGAADDGYSIYAAITVVSLLRRLGLSHPRCVMLFEGQEESGSTHLLQYFKLLEKRIGDVHMMSALDSGCGNYDMLWLTSSLRGNLKGELTVKVLTEGVHSGDGGGIVPSAFSIIRQLFDRLENPQTGKLHDRLFSQIPEDRYQECISTSKIVGNKILSIFPLHGKTQLMQNDPFELYLNRSWRPTVSYLGQDGLPQAKIAGNVCLPEVTIRISIRLPPNLDAKEASEFVKELLESNPPYNAYVKFNIASAGKGLNTPPFHPKLLESLNTASELFYGNKLQVLHEGGSIPFLNSLLDMYPKTQFLILGVLGPGANAHGPNEMLHIGYLKKLICSITKVIFDSSRWLQ